ncbi:DUF6895 family protein [Kitasatospora sp. NPDC006697]|uniref:DUF6895 family protein n=1 Tax=Kitasatospora sp. NPDC006697 TaxID=3364020 RepID=UPI00367CAB79
MTIADPAPTALGDLQRLAAGTLGWLDRHLEHFDPFSPAARAAGHGRAKAALELALLCRCGAPDPGLARATALVRALWQHPDLPALLAEQPDCAAQYRLAFAALAPDRTTATIDVPSADGLSPYQRLELRFYADQAGAPHTLESYQELAARNQLATLPADPSAVSIPAAYAVTHSAFYLADFGRLPVRGLSGPALAHARQLVRTLLAHSVRRAWWDLTAELLLAAHCLGDPPLLTPGGADAVRCLARAQRPDGSIPGRSAATAADGPLPAGPYFARAYHTTLVTALTALRLGEDGGAR